MLWTNRCLKNFFHPSKKSIATGQSVLSVCGEWALLFVQARILDGCKRRRAFRGEENYRESILLAQCFHALYTSPKIIVTGIHGAALGGAMGLVSASDMAITTNTTVFAFSEVKLGLIPATVAPYLLRKISGGKIMEYLLTGRKFSGHDAVSIGLVNRSVPDEQFEQAHEDLLSELLKAAPGAQLKIKELIRSLTGSAPDITIMAKTASLLAETRVSEEAREGIQAFLEKRQPGWMNSQ